MVTVQSVKTALLVGIGIFALLFLGTVWRFVSRLVSFPVLVLFVVIAAYVASELHTGWSKADQNERSTESEDSVLGGDGVTDTTPDVGDHADSVSEDELDRELERLREETGGNDPAVGVETEN